MSGSGNHDIKDSTIHTLTQLLQAKEKELSGVREKYENLRDRLKDEDRRKSCMYFICMVPLRRLKPVLGMEERSEKYEPPRFTGKEHDSDETETEPISTNETSLSDPSHRSDKDRDTTMQPLKSGHEHRCREDSGCSFSSSNNDYEIDCQEINRRLRSNSNLEINNTKSDTERTDHRTDTDIHRNNQDPKNVITARGEIVVHSPSVRGLQEPNAHNIIFKDAHNIIFKEIDMHQSTPESMKKYSRNMTGGDLNESYV